MASNYTGNQGAAQAPSGTPTPDGNPLAVLPTDLTDGVNAASVAQGFKTAMDWIAWLTKPKAIAGSWAQALRRWRSATGHTRALVDHMGFLGGRVASWDETWPSAIGASVTSGGGSATVGPVSIHGQSVAWSAQNDSRINSLKEGLLSASTAPDLAGVKSGLHDAYLAIQFLSFDALGPTGPWRAKLTQAVNNVGGGRVLFAGPDTDTKHHRFAWLEAADTDGDYSMLYRQPHLSYTNDLSFALDWEMWVPGSVAHRILSCGLTEDELLPISTSGQEVAVFQLAPTGNWTACCASSGTYDIIDTGVAPVAGWTRFRLEYAGSNVADDGTRALRFYINGSLVATETAHVPTLGALGGVHASSICVGGGASGATQPLRLGPMRFRSNLYPADVS